MKITLRLLLPVSGLLLLLSACSSQEAEPTPTRQPVHPSPTAEPQPIQPDPSPEAKREFRIITLLPPDAIPAIDDPVFLSATDADEEYDPDEQVLGVVFDGEARAYSTVLLSGHEIVNDTVAGRKIAVTW